MSGYRAAGQPKMSCITSCPFWVAVITSLLRVKQSSRVVTVWMLLWAFPDSSVSVQQFNSICSVVQRLELLLSDFRHHTTVRCSMSPAPDRHKLHLLSSFKMTQQLNSSVSSRQHMSLNQRFWILKRSFLHRKCTKDEDEVGTCTECGNRRAMSISLQKHAVFWRRIFQGEVVEGAERRTSILRKGRMLSRHIYHFCGGCCLVVSQSCKTMTTSFCGGEQLKVYYTIGITSEVVEVFSCNKNQ